MEKLINNAFYDDLHENWYTAKNHPVALLRAENRLRIPWIIRVIQEHYFSKVAVLDVGCGAGMLTNTLAKLGHPVTGIDLSENSLSIAKKFDTTKQVDYQRADACHLPFADQQFDVVCAMDILEHVADPKQLIQEASRVLCPGGLFFFHTFHRNLLSYIMVIKGVEWFVQNTPENMHVYSLFITPKELTRYCSAHDLEVQSMRGVRPKCTSLPFWKMLATKTVCDDFSFQFCSSLKIGYCGFAQKH